jgi:hypothetical protein
VARGVRLAQWAYRSRRQCEPPAIVEAHFERDGATLATYDADALAEAFVSLNGAGRDEKPKRAAS